MQQHIYSTTKKKIFKQSFAIWLFVLMQISFNIYGIFFYQNSNKIFTILFINLIISIITIPGVRIFLNYCKYSIDKEFIITYNFLQLVDKRSSKIIQLNCDEIERVEFYYIPGRSRSPYSSYKYFCFIDKNKKRIVVTFHVLSIADFWLDSLTRNVSSSKLVKIEDLYPIIKKRDI